MKKHSSAFVPAALLASALFAFPVYAAEAELHIICSNGIKGAMDQIVPLYERSSGRHLVIQYGASAQLKRTIESGAPFDLTILTPGTIQDLIKEGKIAAGTETELARAALGAGVRAGAQKTDIGTADVLKRRLLAAKSITFAREGAATGAINHMLERLGIASAVKSRIVLQDVSGRAEETVASGENEIVFGPVSEIIPVHGLEVLGLFPAEFQSPLIMSSALSAGAAEPQAAREFVKFLTSSKAVAAIKTSGMQPSSPAK